MIRLIGLKIVMLASLGLAHALDPEADLAGVARPSDGYIKPVQFIVSVYRENAAISGDTGAKGTDTSLKNTESMRIADGQAAFMGTVKEVPIDRSTYKKLESGLEIRPHLMGQIVQLEILEKNETWNAQTNRIEVSQHHSVVSLPLDQWSKVRGTLNDNQDIEDLYGMNKESSEELWVRVELAPN